MPLEVSRSFGDGNTVPYGPVFDGIRRNSGFVDLRDRPDLADKISEGVFSPKLRELLKRLVINKWYFSLGCDLGEHIEEEQPPASRKVSGGYIQIVAANYAEASTAHYDAFCEAFGRELKSYGEKRKWRITLEGTYVQFNLSDEPPVKAPSIWIWFFAAAKTYERSSQSREELLSAIQEALHAYRVRKCLPRPKGIGASCSD